MLAASTKEVPVATNKKELARWTAFIKPEKEKRGDAEFLFDRRLVIQNNGEEIICIGVTFGGWLIGEDTRRYLASESSIKRYHESPAESEKIAA